jgi:4-hydroxyproline epimerase
MVGALLTPPTTPGAIAGVIYFNSASAIGMCGHGTIGLIVTLAHLGRLGPGTHLVDTPVGLVRADLDATGRVTVHNVPSYRHATGVTIDVPGHGPLRGDVAWGGNWFFLAEAHGLRIAMDNLPALTAFSQAVREAAAAFGITGKDGAEVDHVELFSPSPTPGVDSRNFVLCPGGAYDRSPCGTGTSAKLACLRADGKLAPGQTWRQESVVGSVFEASFESDPEDATRVRPRISGTAHVTAEGVLILDEDDPFCWGIGG